MGIPRARHTASLLPDGRVLVAGGSSPNDDGSFRWESSVELYDSAADSWAATGEMLVPRHSHTATLLPDGRVLVSGGFGADGWLGSAEVWDPKTGRWAAAADMLIARGLHSATLLATGLVLVMGGSNDEELPVTAAELYDPIRDVWVRTEGWADYRSGATTTTLLDSRVLVTGGGAEDQSSASAVIFDPDTGRWDATGAMAEARWHHEAALLGDGKVLVVGGSAGVGVDDLATAELFDPRVGSWTTTGSPSVACFLQTATRLLDGRVLVVGSLRDGSEFDPIACAELYDPERGTWTAATGTLESRRGHTATLLLDGRVLILGESGTGAVASAVLYDPSIGP